MFAVVGEREMTDGTLAVRSRQAGDLGVASIDHVIAQLLESVDTAGSFSLPEASIPEPEVSVD